MPWSAWPTLWSSDSYFQGYDAQAKQSTRFLARGASITACTTDASQRLTNVTAGTGCVLEASPASARFDFSHPRSIGLVITANNTDTGSLFRHGAASPTRFEMSAASTLRITVNNVAIGTLALTGLDGVRDTLVVAWTSRANPDTTAAANAVESTIHAWNVTNSTYERATYLHETSTTKTQTAFFGAADNASTLIYSGAISTIWFENREQSAAEIANDWVAARTPPSTTIDPGHQGHPPQADTFDAQNYHHGPSALWAAVATRGLVRRTLSPLWNEVLNTVPDWTDALLVAADPMIRGAPDSDDWRMHLGWRHTVPVPHTCNYVWARVHVRSWTTSGAAVPIGVRLYSFSRPPGAPLDPGDLGAADPLVTYYGEATITRDDDASEGEYTTIGLIPIARGRAGAYADTTTLAIAVNVDPASASANDANARINVKAAHVVPCFRDEPGGLPFGES
jgi:hypothetical protein